MRTNASSSEENDRRSNHWSKHETKTARDDGRTHAARKKPDSLSTSSTTDLQHNRQSSTSGIWQPKVVHDVGFLVTSLLIIL
jgi:hypothetical protein